MLLRLRQGDALKLTGAAERLSTDVKSNRVICRRDRCQSCGFTSYLKLVEAGTIAADRVPGASALKIFAQAILVEENG